MELIINAVEKQNQKNASDNKYNFKYSIPIFVNDFHKMDFSIA